MKRVPRNRPVLRVLAAGLTVLALTLVLAGPPALADEVEDLIGGAGEAYRGGNLKQTLQLLSRAITALQNRLSLTLAGFLPGELEGWERGEPKVSEFTSETGGLVVFGNLFSAGVVYTRAEGEGRISVTLTNQPELTGIARANLQMLENPFFREKAAEEAAATGEIVEAYAMEPLRGMKQWREAEGAGEIALFVGEALLQAEGTGLEDFAELEAALASVDLDGLAAFAAENRTP